MSFPNALHRPYPADVYRGESGEVSAWLRRDDTEPEITYRSGGSCEYLATGGAGDFLHVPEAGLHGFRGGGGARMLLMFTPGAPREDYFETLDAVGRGAPMSPDERVAFMLQHDTHWV